MPKLLRCEVRSTADNGWPLITLCNVQNTSSPPPSRAPVRQKNVNTLRPLYTFVHLGLSRNLPHDIDPSRVEEYRQAAEKVADGGSGALPYASTVTYATEARGTNPFKEFLEHQQQLVVLMATGGILTSLTGATGIDQGATQAHEETWRTIVRRDAGLIATALNHTVTAPLLDRAFPGRPHLAAFDFETDPSPTPAEIFDLAAKAVAAGYQVTQQELEERTGYRLVEKAPSADYGWPVRAVGNTRSEPALIRQPSSVIRERSERELRALARSL
ncbi:MAG: DUF935 domain-containing protein [Lentisphaeraceae bacterium]|nr:DUF935 domain-containing protein [Lentisphaeraceae bacterium]